MRKIQEPVKFVKNKKYTFLLYDTKGNSYTVKGKLDKTFPNPYLFEFRINKIEIYDYCIVLENVTMKYNKYTKCAYVELEDGLIRKYTVLMLIESVNCKQEVIK